MATAEAVRVRYVLDARMSRFQVRASATGLLSGLGHNPTIAIRDFTGEAQISAAGPADSSVQLRINAASLSVTDDMKDKDRREIERLMNEVVLETSSYPEIVFASSTITAEKTGEGQYRLTLNGDLSLHGATRTEQINGYATVNETQLRAYGDFSLKQSDYGIRPVSFAGGTLKLKDELKFSFDIVARRE
jgi:polyisoprenoid-binding protein YceI